LSSYNPKSIQDVTNPAGIYLAFTGILPD
jgi:hypothetical protein